MTEEAEMNIQWKYVKTLESKSAIDAFETETQYRFSDAFKTCVRENNGGRPVPCAFDTEKTKGRAMKSLLSFNESDASNMRAINGAGIGDIGKAYIAFASDNFGNLLCFDRAGGRVVFWDHETGAVERVADDFAAFLQSLYESE
jgi:hypothetical protein